MKIIQKHFDTLLFSIYCPFITPKKTSLQTNRAWEIMENVGIFCLLLYFSCTGLKDVPFNGDEAVWIPQSAIFEAFYTGNFSSPLWNESYATLVMPPLTPYVIGIGRMIGGISNSQLNNYYNWENDYAQNFLEGRVPSNPVLVWSRLPMAVITAISILISFILLKKAAGRLPSYIWIGLYLMNSYFFYTLRQAMSESPLLVCIALTMLIGYRILIIADSDRRNTKVKLYFYFLFFGIGVGLAESSKLNGLSVLAAGIALSIIVALRLSQIQTLKIRFFLLTSLIVIISSQITWVTLNPFLWTDPLTRTKEMFQLKWIEIHLQADRFAGDKIEGIDMRIKVGTERVFQTFSSLQFTNAWLLNISLFLIGLTILILNSYQDIARSRANPASISFLLVGAAASIPPLFSPLDWGRYFLLPVFFSTIYIAVGIGRLFTYGCNFIINHSIKTFTKPKLENGAFQVK